MKSYTLVTLQFTCILGLLTTTTISNYALVGILLLVISCLLFIWSVGVMQKSKLRILPTPHKKAVLITAGPYKYVRHPMYTAVIIASAALLCFHFSLLRFFIFSILIIVLILKMNYEEKLLQQKFSSYSNYMFNTYRLLWLVY